ncbi:hypothetical protein [Lacrimispora celerecrescens]|nr:hypothetical protein [Lacrimispora celerecrescens]
MKGQCKVMESNEINRLAYMLLRQLHANDCKDHFNSCTITELLEEAGGALGARMTVYKKLQKLVKAGYVAKGVIDDHSDTYYIMEKGINLIEGGIK